MILEDHQYFELVMASWGVHGASIGILYNALLNQVRADQRPACTWFLEMAFVHNIGVCACVHPQGYKLHSHDIEPTYTTSWTCTTSEQVLYLETQFYARSWPL